MTDKVKFIHSKTVILRRKTSCCAKIIDLLFYCSIIDLIGTDTPRFSTKDLRHLMINKIYISCEPKDSSVKHLSGSMTTTVNDYVTYIENKLANNKIYRGILGNEFHGDITEEYISEEIKYKILDSTLTILLISPDMKAADGDERTQWIPWEILYSLTPTLRFDKVMRSNAVIAVILPDKSGDYSYFNKLSTFKILSENIKGGYIPIVKWRQLIYNFDKCIQLVYERKERTHSVYRNVE